MAKVAFIGLGVMGYPMAGHLKAKGGQRSPSTTAPPKAERGSRSTAAARGDPAEAAQGQDFVLCCVGNDNDLRAVTLGDNGAFAGMAKGAVFIDHTTASAESRASCMPRPSRAASIHRRAGLRRPGRRRERRPDRHVRRRRRGLTARAEPVIAAYARMCKLLGPGGLRPAHQDGQPDLHRRPRAGALGGHSFRQEGGARHRGGDRRRSPRARRSPGRWRTATRP